MPGERRIRSIGGDPMIDLVKTLDSQPPQWSVESLPLRHDRGEVAAVSALVRSDNGETIALVHPDFSPIQNQQGIELGESLGYKFQGARVAHEGRRVFLIFELQRLEMAGEEVSVFLCLTNAYSSELTTLSLEAPDKEAFLAPHLLFRRQACLNVFDSLWFSRWNSPRIVPSRAESAELLRSWIGENIDGSLTKAQTLLEARVNSALIRDSMLDFLIGADEHTLFDLWSNTPDLEPIRETGWGAYQAVAAYLTHHYPHEDPNWWLNEEDLAFDFLSSAKTHFLTHTDVPYLAWNRETGSYERMK